MLDPDDRILTTQLKEDADTIHLVKLQEQCRRRRQQRIDAGDESARLDFSLLVQQQQRGPVAAGATGAGSADGGVPAAVGPRMVPAPRSGGWQPRSWGGKGGKPAARPQQTYAPKAKGAKK